MDSSALRRTLIGAACLLAATSLVACKRASGDASHGSAGREERSVGDDMKGVGKATEKAAKDIGNAASELGDKARQNLGDATNKVGADAEDGWITAKVKTELTSAGVDPLHVHVDTDKKIVTLSGTVESAAQARKAVTAAKAVTGVLSVQDHLFVKPGQR
jgi:hypothetical protein